MANYNSLKSSIQTNVKTNSNEEITGAIMQSILLSMVNALGAGYQYMGIATPSTAPGTPDGRVFYIAWQPGAYSNFNAINIGSNEVCILRYDTAWHKDVTGVCSTNFIADELGYSRQKFTVSPGTNHSSLSDRIYCDIPAGETFALQAELLDGAAIANYTLYFLYDGDTSATTINAYSFATKTRTFTASRRIREIRYYISGSAITTAGSVQFTLLAKWAYQWQNISTAYQNSLVNSAKIQDDYNSTKGNIVLDEVNKKVIIKKNAFRILSAGRNGVGTSLSADMELSYAGTGLNGGWMLSKSAFLNGEGTTVALTSSNVFFANVNTANFNDNILLFYCYQGHLIPIGLFGPQLLQRQLDTLKTTAANFDQNMRSYFGFQESSFNITPGTNHSSSADSIYCDIKAGDKFTIVSELLDGAAATVYALFVWYVGGTSSTLIGSYGYGSRTFTAAQDIYRIGFYINGPYISAAGKAHFEVYSNFGYQMNEQSAITERVEQDVMIAFDSFNNMHENLLIDEQAKTVTLRYQGMRFRYRKSAFVLDRGAAAGDFVMSYASGVAPNGGWMLRRAAVTGENIELNSTNVFYAAVGTDNFNNNILLFGVYYGTLMPVGLLGPYLQQTRLLRPLRENMFQSAYNPISVDTKANEFAELLNNSGVAETFIFMTDPHLLGASNNFDKATFKTYISLLQKYYNSTPVDWMICGGDWLNQGDYQVNAVAKLGYMDATMRKLFKHYFPVLGNHDTNYQGTVSASDSTRGDLTNQTLINLMFRPYGRMFYDFKGHQTHFVVLDTQLDWNIDMNEYMWSQISWLAGVLSENTMAHVVIVQHIYKVNGNTIPFAVNVQSLAAAFNSKGSVTLNNVTYNFAGTTGRIACIIAGHSHVDAIYTDDGIPVWLTDNMQEGNTPTFDLCLIDYTANKMKSVRVGSGSNREMDLA